MTIDNHLNGEDRQFVKTKLQAGDIMRFQNGGKTITFYRPIERIGLVELRRDDGGGENFHFCRVISDTLEVAQMVAHVCGLNVEPTKYKPFDKADEQFLFKDIQH